MELSVCIEMIGREVPFVERIALAAQAGYKAIEFWGCVGKDIPAIAEATAMHGIAVAGMVGTGGKLVDPAQHDAAEAELKGSIDIARQLGCRTLIVTTGNEIPGMFREAQHESVVKGLRTLAPIAEDAGVTLVLEPLNILVNHKGYYLSTSAEGFQIIREVGSPAVRLLFDIYHQQITEGNVTANLTDNIGLVGHLHVADVPGRHEPGSGELNYSHILAAAEAAGYAGYAGLEFSPTGQSLEVLQNVRRLIGGLGNVGSVTSA